MIKKEYPALGECCYLETLPGGLQIRIVPKRGFARSYAFFAAGYGSIDTKYQVNGKQVQSPDGVAHYLEHKMFDMDGENVMEAFAASGANPNAFTSYNMTAYYFDCTEQFEANLRLLLRFVSTPYFTQQTVDKERGIIAQEIRMYEDSPDSRCYENLFAGLYAHHPVRVPIAGSVESIQKITPQVLYDCHRAFYAPNNMMLCVVGDVDPEMVCRVAQETLPQAEPFSCVRDYGPAEDAVPAKKRMEAAMEVAMPMFHIGFKCPAAPKGEAAMRQEFVGDLAAEVLMGESSPLFSRLYESGLIDADFGAGYESVPGAAMVTASGDSCDPDKVLDAILQEAERIKKDGVDVALFTRLKKSAIGRRLRALDSFESICYRICAYYFEGTDYFSFLPVYESITMEEVAQFLRRTVAEKQTAISIIWPKERMCTE